MSLLEQDRSFLYEAGEYETPEKCYNLPGKLSIVHVGQIIIRIETGQPFSTEQPDSNDADLIENQKRHAHEHLVDDIGGRGDNGRNNKTDQYGIFPVAVQKTYIHHAHLGQQDHKDRQFEDYAKGDEQPQGKGEIFRHRRHWTQIVCSVADKEAKGRRENDKIPEGDAAQETYGGQHCKRQEHFFSWAYSPGPINLQIW